MTALAATVQTVKLPRGWTPAQFQTLKDMASGGFSAREIGIKLDRTRLAIIGVAYRKKIKIGGRVRPNQYAPREIVSHKKASRSQKNHQSGNKSNGPIYRAAPRVARDENPVKSDRLHRSKAFEPSFAPAGARHLTLVDLEPGQCKWPLFTDGSRLFCGADILKNEDGEPIHHVYCSAHASLARFKNQKGNGY